MYGPKKRVDGFLNLYSQTNNEDIEFTYEIGKRILPNFDIYSENGFTILEYLIHFLTIRGNPLDRWYTMYCGMNDRSNYKPRKHGYNNVIKFEEKYEYGSSKKKR